MYTESQPKQKKPYNLKREFKKGAIVGLAVTVISVGIGLVTKGEMRNNLLETMLAATIATPIIVGITASAFYAMGFTGNFFYRNNA